MTDNKNKTLNDELEEITAGSNPDIDDSKTRKSPQGLYCYAGRRGISSSSPICATTSFACELYDSCHNPEKQKEY